MSQILSKFLADANVTNEKIATGIDAAKLADGTVSNAELQFINSLSSNAQDQITARAVATRNINTSANSGVSGGGDLSADRSIVVAPDNANAGTVASGDLVLVADVSNSNALIKVTAASIAALGAGSTNEKQTFVLIAGDITNQFLDLSQVAKTNSINFIVKNGGAMLEGASYDYTVNYTGGAGGLTRITFVNDLATAGASALIATDVVQVQYEY